MKRLIVMSMLLISMVGLSNATSFLDPHPPLSGQIIELKTISSEQSSGSIEIIYPQFNDKKLNQYINKIILNQKRIHEKYVHEEDSGTSAGLWIETQEMISADNRYISIIFRISTFYGGAHPNHTLKTLVYDTHTKKVVGLSHFFTGDRNYLKTVTKKTRSILLKKSEEVSTKQRIYNGTIPKRSSFQFFGIDNKDGKNILRIYFPAYQVGPYAAGEQSVERILDK